MADAVAVAYVHGNEVSHSWHVSLLQLVSHDLQHGRRVTQAGCMATRYGTDGLVAARNETVTRFLADDKGDWMLWLDTDMGFQPDILDRLLAAADPQERPIVGALCFAQREVLGDGMGGFRCLATPTIYDWVTRGDGHVFVGVAAYPVNALVRCAGTGSAAILIHKSVFQRIFEADGPVWYERMWNPTSEKLISEDLSFCVRAGQLGIPVHVHTGVRTSHFKSLWLAEPDFWSATVAPPATEQVAVIVPVMRRPQNAAPFMASLRATTGLATVYAVAEPGDAETIAAWRKAGAELILGDDEWVGGLQRPIAVSFAEKMNLGYRQTNEPWLFMAGDDIRFHPGWLDQAQAVAGGQFHVIGTNDLANPRVTAGEHATHLLIRRSYVDEHGASWDGPKVVCHEGYRHWYVDDEIVTAAKRRGAWAMALGSVVEHRHPLFGTAENDEVYELGQSFAKQDYARFRQRLATYAPEVAGAR